MAFRAVGRDAAGEDVEPLPGGEIPRLPVDRIGKVTRRKKIDGSRLIFRVEEQDLFQAPSNPRKAYLLQRLRMDDGRGFEHGHDEFRIAYYMIGHKGRSRNKWAFGQFAPIMTPEDLAAIVQRMRDRGWLTEVAPPPADETLAPNDHSSTERLETGHADHRDGQ